MLRSCRCLDVGRDLGGAADTQHGLQQAEGWEALGKTCPFPIHRCWVVEEAFPSASWVSAWRGPSPPKAQKKPKPWKRGGEALKSESAAAGSERCCGPLCWCPRSHPGRSGATQPWGQQLGGALAWLAGARRDHGAVWVSLGQQKTLCSSAVVPELKWRCTPCQNEEQLLLGSEGGTFRGLGPGRSPGVTCLPPVTAEVLKLRRINAG